MGIEKKVLIGLGILLLGMAVFYHTKIYTTEKNKKIAATTEAAIETVVEEKEEEYDKVKLYIPEIESKILTKKKENIAKKTPEKKIKLVFEKIKENSSDKYFNKNSEIVNVFIEGNDRVYINLSRDFIEEKSTSDIKALTLYSVVNSICALGYSKVKFMIENEDVNKLGGEIDATDYFEKESSLSKGE